MCDKFVGDVFKTFNSRAGKKLAEPRDRLKGNKLQSASFFFLFLLSPSLFCEVKHLLLFFFSLSLFFGIKAYRILHLPVLAYFVEKVCRERLVGSGDDVA